MKKNLYNSLQDFRIKNDEVFDDLVEYAVYNDLGMETFDNIEYLFNRYGAYIPKLICCTQNLFKTGFLIQIWL